MRLRCVKMQSGKKIRLKRILDENTCRSVIFAMDHGTFLGPMKGIQDVKKITSQVAAGGADAIIVLKGIAKLISSEIRKDMGLIIQISSSTTLSPKPNFIALSASLKEAVRLGADGVAVFVTLGHENEHYMLEMLGKIAWQCDDYGMPLLAMAEYPYPEKGKKYDINYLKYACRVVAEFGADIIKTNYTGDIESFKEIVEYCPVPILIAGGSKMETDEEVLKTVESAMKAGANGVSFGRNIFQHENPEAITKAIVQVVHRGISVNEALRILNSK